MRRIKVIGTAAALLACSMGTSWADLDLQFSSDQNATVAFAGGAFNFSPAATSQTPNPDQFSITLSTGVGDSVGDTGYITGLFTIGSKISANYYNVNGNGTFNISDGNGHLLSGNIAWVDLASLGTSGDVNVNGVLNFTSITYSGQQQDLLALAAGHLASDDITFVIPATNPGSPVATADSLAGGQHFQTTFDGDIYSTVPEPSTLISGALLLLPFGASTLRILRRQRAA